MEDDTLFSLFILTGLLAIFISGYNLTIAWRKSMPVWKRVVLVLLTTIVHIILFWFISYTATPPQRSSGNGNPILLLVMPLALTVAAYVLSIGIYVYRWLRDHDLRWRWGTIAAGGLLVVSMGVPAAALSRHVRSEVMKHQSYDPGLSPLTMHNNGVLCNGYTFMLLIGIAVLLAGVISLFTVRKSAFE